MISRLSSLFTVVTWIVIVLFGLTQVQAQTEQQPTFQPDVPERQLYFAYEESGLNVAALDPGNLLLAKSVLLTNLYRDGNISFSLSFDKKNWARFGMGPRYSSFFNMKDQLGCYCILITDYGPDNKIKKEYYLSRGRCYSVFWNSQQACWDMQENPCRRRN
ncbi:MAG: hypothetical protein AAF828_08855 [Bacteroidota bacterium]